MKEPAKKEDADMELWRPVTLGIGSSLSISQRKRDLQTSATVNPLSHSTGSLYSKSATTPRHKLVSRTDRYRSKSVMNASSSHWKLPAYSTLIGSLQVS